MAEELADPSSEGVDVTVYTNTYHGTYTGTLDDTRYCEWCGTGVTHSGMCPRVKAIDYNQNGQIMRVEFHNQRYPR